MKRLIILALLCCSCHQENQYETALKKYVAEDLHFDQERIEFQLEQMKYKALEQPKKYTSYYEEAAFINKKCQEFEQMALSTDNKDSINHHYNKLKEELSKTKFVHNEFINAAFEQLPQLLSTEIDKYNLLRTLKEINFKANHMVVNPESISTDCGSTNDHPTLLAIRLNKHQVALNIYSRLMADFPEDFDVESIHIDVKDLNNNPVQVVRPMNDLVRSIIYETQSDTLFVDATIMTNKVMGLIASKNQSAVVVGELKPFDHYNLQDYIDFLLKED